MAHSRYTGKEATTHIAGVTITGWRKIIIAEKGKPATKTFDITVESDGSYVELDDPMGGKGSPSVTVTVEGLLSATDSADTGLTETAVGSTIASLTIHKKAAGDLMTITDALFKSFKTEAKLGDLVPYTAVFEKSTDAGVWSTAA